MQRQGLTLSFSTTQVLTGFAVLSLGVLSLFIATGFSPGHGHTHLHEPGGTEISEETLRDRFSVLRTKSTNACGAQPQHLADIPDGQRMQGSCCSPMVFHSYEEQIRGLHTQYGNQESIPSDPYNVSVKWAKHMIEYYEDTELPEEQQRMYDEAVALSDEGGPCCCKCWHWYAYGGLGKKLILEHGFTAEHVAQVWDLSGACGGSHSHS